MKMTDGKRTIDIRMMVWSDQSNGYSPDFSADFFQRETDSNGVAHVDDVGYCIDQANDWKSSIGDFSDAEKNENNTVFVEEI